MADLFKKTGRWKKIFAREVQAHGRLFMGLPVQTRLEIGKTGWNN
jgi:hypothetical protein